MSVREDVGKGMWRKIRNGKSTRRTAGFQITKRGNLQPTSLRTIGYKKWKN